MRARHSIIVAMVALYVVSHWIPFGDTALYPLTLLTTWVHEMGHGITALLVGGQFERLDIFADAGGQAAAFGEPGWRDAAVAAGGLLAPPILGALILGTVHGPRRARIFLLALAGAIVVSLAIWVRSTTGFIAMPICVVALVWAAWRGFREHPERRVVVAQILGLVLALDTLTRMITYVFMEEVEVNGTTSPTDISLIAKNFGGNYMLWGAVITMIAVGLLALGAWLGWRQRPRPVTWVAASQRPRPQVRPKPANKQPASRRPSMR